MIMTRLNAAALRTRLDTSGGFTVRLNLPSTATYGLRGTFGEGPRKGFAIGNPKYTRTFTWDYPFGAGDVALFALDHLDTLALPGRYFGAWRDEETGTVHLDVISIVEDKTLALAMATERGELAVWDLSRGEEIRTAVVPAN
jgi:hypothetical protein